MKQLNDSPGIFTVSEQHKVNRLRNLVMKIDRNIQRLEAQIWKLKKQRQAVEREIERLSQ